MPCSDHTRIEFNGCMSPVIRSEGPWLFLHWAGLHLIWPVYKALSHFLKESSSSVINWSGFHLSASFESVVKCSACFVCRVDKCQVGIVSLCNLERCKWCIFCMWAKKMGWSLLQGSWHRFIDKRLQKVLAFTSHLFQVLQHTPAILWIGLKRGFKEKLFELASVLIANFAGTYSNFYTPLQPGRPSAISGGSQTSLSWCWCIAHHEASVELIHGWSDMLHHIGLQRPPKTCSTQGVGGKAARVESWLFICTSRDQNPSFHLVKKSNIARLPATGFTWKTRNWSKNYKQADGIIYINTRSSFFFSQIVQIWLGQTDL